MHVPYVEVGALAFEIRLIEKNLVFGVVICKTHGPLGTAQSDVCKTDACKELGDFPLRKVRRGRNSSFARQSTDDQIRGGGGVSLDFRRPESNHCPAIVE